MSNVLFREKAWRFLADLLASEKAVILCDMNTKQCLDFMFSVCPAATGLPILEIPAGEQNKNLKTCEMLWYQLTELGADRDTVLVNLGGGVVTDIGGFVASTYMRGIRFINVPTSLLGMVDAAIGGKTGVDYGGLKNRIGTFSQPEAVLVDSNFLKTLPARQYRNGLAEVLKHSFISDPTILNLVEPHCVRLRFDENSDDEGELISRSIQVKLDVVNRDEKEKGERKKLNFGHTVGHAIESHLLDSDHPILHGEAVAAGMIMESWLSNELLQLPEEELKTICSVTDSLFTRIELSHADWEAVKRLIAYDKKNRNGEAQFVLLNSTGEAVIDQFVAEEQLDGAFRFYTQQA